MPPIQREKNYWRNQWLGILGGAGAGLMLVALIPALADRFGLLTVVLWSAVLGGVISSWEGFVRAGAALTRSQNRLINLLVGLGIPALLLLLIFTIFSLLAQ
jgi:hypothetical protein